MDTLRGNTADLVTSQWSQDFWISIPALYNGQTAVVTSFEAAADKVQAASMQDHGTPQCEDSLVAAHAG